MKRITKTLLGLVLIASTATAVKHICTRKGTVMKWEEEKSMSKITTDPSIREFKHGDILRHFKGGIYVYIGQGIHTETNEELVTYYNMLKPEQLYSRPKEMFFSEVERDKYPDAEQKYRLEKIDSRLSASEIAMIMFHDEK